MQHAGVQVAVRARQAPRRAHAPASLLDTRHEGHCWSSSRSFKHSIFPVSFLTPHLDAIAVVLVQCVHVGALKPITGCGASEGGEPRVKSGAAAAGMAGMPACGLLSCSRMQLGCWLIDTARLTGW
jgi:hypothetical protein